MRSLESTESKAEALVENLDQRRMMEKKNYEASRKVLEKIQAARKKQLSLNSSITLKNQILEQKRQELMKRKEDIRRRQVRQGGIIRLIILF